MPPTVHAGSTKRVSLALHKGATQAAKRNMHTPHKHAQPLKHTAHGYQYIHTSSRKKNPDACEMVCKHVLALVVPAAHATAIHHSPDATNARWWKGGGAACALDVHSHTLTVAHPTHVHHPTAAAPPQVVHDTECKGRSSSGTTAVPVVVADAAVTALPRNGIDVAQAAHTSHIHDTIQARPLHQHNRTS